MSKKVIKTCWWTCAFPALLTAQTLQDTFTKHFLVYAVTLLSILHTLTHQYFASCWTVQHVDWEGQGSSLWPSAWQTTTLPSELLPSQMSVCVHVCVWRAFVCCWFSRRWQACGKGLDFHAFSSTLKPHQRHSLHNKSRVLSHTHIQMHRRTC